MLYKITIAVIHSLHCILQSVIYVSFYTTLVIRILVCVHMYIVLCSSILISTLYHLYLHMYMNDEHTSIIEHQMSQVTCHLSGYQIGVICQL